MHKFKHMRNEEIYHYDTDAAWMGVIGYGDIAISANCDKNAVSYSNFGTSYDLPAGVTAGAPAQSYLAGAYHF